MRRGAFRALTNARWIFLKELSSFLGSNLPIGAVAIVALFCGAISVVIGANPGIGKANIVMVLFRVFYMILLVVPASLAMFSFVSERRQGTMELLYTLPVTDFEMVLGKFFMGLLSIAVISVGITFFYVVWIADASLFVALAGVFGLMLAGTYAYCVGLFASSLTDSYLLGFLVTTLVLFIVDVGGFFAGLLPSPAREVLTHMHAYSQFFPFARGIIPLKGVVFFSSLAALFLFLTVKVLESRRWRGSES